MLDWPGYPPVELLPESETMFFQRYDEDRFAFRREASGDVAGLTVHRGARQLPFTRVPALTARDLAAYAGVYHSDELQVTMTSNTATATLLMPILAAAAIAADIEPRLIMVPATISASFAFMLPVATPPNAIIFGSEELSIRTMAREGFVLNLAGVIVVSIICFIMFR